MISCHATLHACLPQFTLHDWGKKYNLYGVLAEQYTHKSCYPAEVKLPGEESFACLHGADRRDAKGSEATLVISMCRRPSNALAV